MSSDTNKKKIYNRINFKKHIMVSQWDEGIVRTLEKLCMLKNLHSYHISNCLKGLFRACYLANGLIFVTLPVYAAVYKSDLRLN